jgi:hypothetical protein
VGEVCFGVGDQMTSKGEGARGQTSKTKWLGLGVGEYSGGLGFQWSGPGWSGRMWI